MIPGFNNCVEVFREAEKLHEDMMEPYVNRLADVADDAAQTIAIMRDGLAATFRQRYPMPEEFWPTPMVARPVATPEPSVVA